MPVNWEQFKDVIVELYIRRGYTLKRLQEIMSVEHRINASSRTFKMKLDEWNIRKYKRREKVPRIKTRSRTTSPILVSGPTDANSPSSASNSSASRGSSTSTESDATLDLNFLGVLQDTLDSGPFSLQTSMAIPDNLADDAHGLEPIVNSSLMFSPSRTDSKSLQLLENCPGMAPIAIEILFRNWKPGGEYMDYALRFLADKDYCQNLMSAYLTQWTHQDETLFDLLYFYVRPTDPKSYTLLTKALLRADMASKNTTWAPLWQSAIQTTEWAVAKIYLFALQVHLFIDDVLFQCAVAVVAEEILKTKRITLVNWKADEEAFPEKAREQYMEIVKDCRELQINLDPAIQQSMRISWVP